MTTSTDGELQRRDLTDHATTIAEALATAVAPVYAPRRTPAPRLTTSPNARSHGEP
jgi:hypothetical protein